MASSSPSEVCIRLAAASDVPHIHQLIEPFVANRQILPRAVEDLYGLVENGFVAESAGELVGFAAVEIYSKKLAELLCLAVSEKCQGQGVGRMLVERCVQRAEELEIVEVMAITANDDFFRSCGFDYTLPQQKRALFIHTRDEH